MDINEIVDNMAARHPWELSRTDSLLWEFEPFLEACGPDCRYLDLGAGDQFFDDALLSMHPGFSAVAVDIGYTPEIRRKLTERVRNSDRILMKSSLDEEIGAPFDFMLMLDFLEYAVDETSWMRKAADQVKDGGYVLLALPAFQILDCEHDRIVKSLQRYDKKRIRSILARVPQLTPERMHYFYTPLFFIRLLQKFSGSRIDPQRKIIRGWKFSEKHFLTRIIKGILDLDFRLHAIFSKVRLDPPGLSLMVLCKRVAAETSETEC